MSDALRVIPSRLVHQFICEWPHGLFEPCVRSVLEDLCDVSLCPVLWSIYLAMQLLVT